MRTALGDFLRKLRINKGEILKTMADKLNITSSFLSAVENGKKKMPQNWYKLLKSIYNLDSNQISELKNAEIESSNIIKLSVEHASDTNKQLAVLLARQFDHIDDDTSTAILNLLKNKGKIKDE